MTISGQYRLTETFSANYPQLTEQPPELFVLKPRAKSLIFHSPSESQANNFSTLTFFRSRYHIGEILSNERLKISKIVTTEKN